MNIRKATLADADRITQLFSQVQNLHAAAVPGLFKTATGVFSSPVPLTELLVNAEHHFVVAEAYEGGGPVGYLWAQIRDREETTSTYAQRSLYIEHIGVDSNMQGRGAGAALIQAARDLARQLGATQVALDTWTFNTKAQGFFAAQGFEDSCHRMWLNL